MIEPGDGLLIVDLQKYYVDPESDFYRYSETCHPGAMDYISQRWRDTVEPNAKKLLTAFRAHDRPVIYLRLCGRNLERSDLHAFFQASFRDGQKLGFAAVYPLADDPAAHPPDSIAPRPGEAVFPKTTFSGFHSGGLAAHLAAADQGPMIQRLILIGLATSQCVETTARDASDFGYGVVLIEDALADYSETAHMASLFSSQAVCGGDIRSTQEYLENAE